MCINFTMILRDLFDATDNTFANQNQKAHAQWTKPTGINVELADFVNVCSRA